MSLSFATVGLKPLRQRKLAATGPDDMFSALTVNADGWRLEATVLNAKVGGTYSGLNDYANPAIVLNVSSTSWDASGNSSTLTRNVVATAYLRKPYANGTAREETTSGSNFTTIYSLSERIYQNDVVNYATIAAAAFTDNGGGGSLASNSGGQNSVTNSSALAYPLPQAVWLTPHLERITSASWAPRLLVMHRYARNGQPVRAVKFTATDESLNSVTSTVSALTTGQYSASTLHANWFQPSWNLSSLTDGQNITVDAVIYPWVGNAYTLSVNADAYPSPNVSTLRAVCDAGGTFGTIYAYVDGVGAGSPAANTNPATAAANPFASISAAVTAAVALNNSTYSRNNVSGVTIRIPAATTITSLGGSLASVAEGKLPLLIEGINQTTSIYQHQATNGNYNIPGAIKWKNLTFRRNATGGSVIGIVGKNLVANQIVFEDVVFGLNGAAYYQFLITDIGRGYYVNCSGVNIGLAAAGAALQQAALVAGCDFTGSNANNVMSCYSIVSTKYTATSGIPYDLVNATSDGAGSRKGGMVAFNYFSSTDNQCLKSEYGNYGNAGFSLFGNVFEQFGPTPTSLMELFGGTTSSVSNVMECANTFAGERTIIGYNDVGSSSLLRDIVSKHSIHLYWNSKGDYFTTPNANRTGNWVLRHHVDGGYNFVDLGGSDATTVGSYDAWLGEAFGDLKNELPRGWVVTGNPDFVNDNSNTGSDDGLGDYSLGGSTQVPQIPAGMTMFAVDLYGTAIPTDGTAYAGAVQ